MNGVHVHSVVKKHSKQKQNYLPKKKKFQSTKEYLMFLNKGCCTYCGNKFSKEEMCLTTKNHEWKGLFEPQNNKVVACKSCTSKKGKMNHNEFKQYLKMQRKKIRTEILDNYSYFASEVFDRYENKCIYCEFEFGFTSKQRKLTIDHKKSIFKLGDNGKKNLASACSQHNKEKDTMTPKEFFEYLEKQGRKHNLYQQISK